MKRLIMVLALVVAVTSVAQATPTPFLQIDDGSYSSRNTSIIVRIWQYGPSPDWANVYLSAQGLTSPQAAGSNYPWLQGPANDWYCADLNSFQGLSNWDFYDTAVMTEPWGNPAGSYGTMDGLKRAAWLIDTYHDAAHGNADKRASLQLAVWEAIYDNEAELDITSGNFRTDGFNNTTITNKAADWYAESYGKSGRGVYAVDGQNVLGRTEIPEPGTLILLGLGLTVAGFGVIRRRRKA